MDFELQQIPVPYGNPARMQNLVEIDSAIQVKIISQLLTIVGRVCADDLSLSTPPPPTRMQNLVETGPLMFFLLYDFQTYIQT